MGVLGFDDAEQGRGRRLIRRSYKTISRTQAYAVEENVSEKKHGQHQKEEWRKKWK